MSDVDLSPPRAAVGRADLLVLALLAMSLCGNVVLGLAMSRLVLRVGNIQQAESGRPAGPAIGAQLPTLNAQRSGGAKESIAFASNDRPTLIYVFTPTCHWCSLNLENVRALIAEAGKSYRVIGLSLDPEVDRYEQRVHLGIPIYVRPSRETFESLALGSTPQTVVASSQGRVVKSWVGAYAGGIGREVESYFKITLPGLVRETEQAPRIRLTR
jgi:hypothetical protein